MHVAYGHRYVKTRILNATLEWYDLTEEDIIEFKSITNIDGSFDIPKAIMRRIKRNISLGLTPNVVRKRHGKYSKNTAVLDNL